MSLISENQIGFKENCRTSDHLFSIKTIIDHYKSKKVYAAFIDLRKAFDTVWREGLFYKLLNSNISQKLFNILFSMYSNTTSRIKFSDGLGKIFNSECGVKQGDVLSPTLFNIFIDGIVSDLKQNVKCEPVHVNNLNVNCLLYADDIVILSESKSGLQTSLDILYNYCSNWKLQVNVDKSKIMVFNSNSKHQSINFTFNGNTMQVVSKYCYLGIVLKSNGKFNLATSVLVEKARKAYFKMKKIIGIDNPCKLLEKLFDSIVLPVLLYCCEIWGVDLSLKDISVIEKFHVKFLKDILGLHCKASNAGCLAELNRLPLWSKISFSSIKYWNHLITSNSLAFKLYQGTINSNSWTKKIYGILDNLGFSNISNYKSTIQHFLPNIKQRIIDQCIQEQSSKIFSSEKLSFFQKLYMRKRSPYVDILRKRSERSSISRIRLSAHKLAIESGRYNATIRNERYCNACKTGAIEDETHFLFQCKAYSHLRNSYFSNFYKISKINIANNLDKERYILHVCLNSEIHTILNITVKFINDCFEHRCQLV